MLGRSASWEAGGTPPVAALIVGSAPWSADDSRHIGEVLGARTLVSLQDDRDLAARGLGWSTLWALHVRAGLRAERVPIRDLDARDLARHLPRAVEVVEQALASGRRVYLHCTAGLNRSPTVAVAVRARALGGLEAALAELSVVHPAAVVERQVLIAWARAERLGAR
jgi:protein-tyrosine phosphatase